MPGYKPAPKKRKPKPKVSTQTPIFGSIEDGDAEEFAECLSQTPECLKEVNKNGWTPLHQAAFSGQLAMLNTLLENREDPVMISCAGGKRSLQLVTRLRAEGWTGALSVNGGFSAWKRAGFPCEYPEGLDAESVERYARQLRLPEFGVNGQQALSRSRVLLVGVGGLGSP